MAWRVRRRRDGTRLVERSHRGGWRPWVVDAPSAALAKLGLKGRGLYAARAFQPGDVIGRYDGVPVAEDEVAALVAAGHDKLARIGGQVLDGKDQGPPFLQLLNDPRGTDRRATAQLRPSGRVVAVEELSTYPAPGSELLISYGDDYWRCQPS